MDTILIMVSLTIGLIIIGIIEFKRHERFLDSIPVRIHVNGTRGKSSVSRLIGAGLRAGGFRAVTKVTGTFPRLILEDGSEFHINRRGGANIIEQLSIVKTASKRKANALVIECMALQPEYQKISEEKMIKSTIGVITNIRADHLDVMGPTVDDVAKAISNTVPINGILVTGEKVHNLIRKRADDKGSEIVEAETESVSLEAMNGFSYIEHRENVAIALEVCKLMDIRPKKALKEMYKTIPDEGALARYRIKRNGTHIDFINAFAANDPDSTLLIRKMLRDRGYIFDPEYIILNTRADRIERSKQLLAMIGEKIIGELKSVFLMGDYVEMVYRSAIKNRIPGDKIIMIRSRSPETIYSEIMAQFTGSGSILATGNMGGSGAALSDYFRDRSSNR